MTTWSDLRDTTDIREIDDSRSLACNSMQSQYAASPNTVSLVQGFARLVDPYDDITNFYDLIFNIRTAVGAGLDNWGEILGIKRTIRDSVNDEAIVLDDHYYRALLFYKALANISSSNIASLNSLLATLTGTDIGHFEGHSYVLETDVMTIRWVFEYFMSDMQLAIFKAAGTLARGAGVGWEIYHIDPDQTFGYRHSAMQPFCQAPFAPTTVITGSDNYVKQRTHSSF